MFLAAALTLWPLSFVIAQNDPNLVTGDFAPVMVGATLEQGSVKVVMSPYRVAKYVWNEANFGRKPDDTFKAPNAPFSSISGGTINYRSEDVKRLRQSFQEVPDLYMKKNLCHRWHYEAQEVLLRTDGKDNLTVGYTETGLCFFKPPDKSVFLPICHPSKVTQYKIVSMAQMPLPRNFANSPMMAFDEAGTVMALTAAGIGGCGNGTPTFMKQSGLYFLDKDNAAGVTSGGLSDLQGDEHVKSYELHFAYSMIESIVYFESNLYFSQGLVRKTKNFIKGFGPNFADLVPSNLLTGSQYNRNVMALEIYRYNDTLYMHGTGAQYSTDSTGNQVPVYWRCLLPKGQKFSTADATELEYAMPGSNFCKTVALKEHVMPADFAFYKTNSCQKLVAFYQYALRIFEPTDDLEIAGADPAKYPYHVVDWMNFQLNAVLFYQGRYYYFITTNRVMIEPSVRQGGCDEILKNPGNLEEHYASELMLLSVRSITKNQAVPEMPKYQFDPHRVGTKIAQSSQIKLSDFKWDPPLEYRREVPNQYVIGGSNGGGNNGGGGVNNGTVVVRGGGGGGTSIVMIIIVLLFVLAIVGAIFYFWFLTTPKETSARLRSRRSSSPSGKKPGSTLGSGVLTARSGLSPTPAGKSSTPMKTSTKSTADKGPKSKSKSPLGKTKSKVSVGKSTNKSPKSRSGKSKSTKTPGKS